MKLVAVLALAAGSAAAPLVLAPAVTAAPPPAGPCDGAPCVPYVDHNIDASASCVPANRYVFGLDAAGNTYACNAAREWAPQQPLIGVRLSRQPCGEDKGLAQSPDGIVLSCISGGWTADFESFYY
jgi:hypothetical protein